MSATVFGQTVPDADATRMIGAARTGVANDLATELAANTTFTDAVAVSTSLSSRYLPVQRLELTTTAQIALSTSYQNGRRHSIGARDWPSPTDAPAPTQYRICALIYRGGTGALNDGDVIDIRMVNDAVTELVKTSSTYASSTMGSNYIHRQAWTTLPGSGSEYDGYWQVRNATGARGTLERIWLEVR